MIMTITVKMLRQKPVNWLKVFAHRVQNFCTLKNKYDNHVYTLPLKISSVIKFGSGLIFCVFASVASILIGKDDEYKKMKNAYENFGLSVQEP